MSRCAQVHSAGVKKILPPREAEIEDDTVKSSEAVSALNLAHPFRVVKSLDS